MEELILGRKQTPIEIALDVDEAGCTTARKLYKWLELRPGDYARWVDKNIVNNRFAEEGKDYSASMRSENVESSENGVDIGLNHSASMRSEKKTRGKFAQDYLLTASFAKRLAMASSSTKGEETRLYFLKVEEALAGMAVKAEPMTQAELVLWSAQRLVDIERRQRQLEQKTAQLQDWQADQERQVAEIKSQQAEQADKLKVLEAINTTHPEGEFSVAGYASLNGIHVGVKEASFVGKLASDMCRTRGITIGKIKDPRFGSVHLYPSYVLDEAFMFL